MATHTESTAGALTTKIDLIRDSFSHLLTVSFAKTNSKHYPLAVSIAEGASKYETQYIGPALVHFAAFSKRKDDASRAVALLDYIQGWKTTQIFANGRLVGHASRVIDVLRCYLEALACNDYRAHCFKIVDDPFSDKRSSGLWLTISVSEPPPDEPSVKYIFPCARLSGYFSLQRGHPASAENMIQAAGIRHGCDWCPNFDATNFQKLEDDAPNPVS